MAERCPEMKGRPRLPMNRALVFTKALAIAFLLPGLCVARSGTQNSPQGSSRSACRIDAIYFEGWKAEQISNEWLKLIIVPQLGGRLMQVFFAGHPFLFVNSEYKGRYLPPSEGAAKGKWFNYGGDKIWPMPEGAQGEHHWPGPISDELDDGAYAFQALSQDSRCTLRLDGPPDKRTGLQYSREISIGRDSPEIAFHAVMKNISARPIEWSMQSVTQYDTADLQTAGAYNRDFWAFTPINPQSSYLDGYHVRSGLADDPSFSVKNDLFTLHWLYLQNEVWIDSPGGWLAVADYSNQFALIERFVFREGGDYPGKSDSDLLQEWSGSRHRQQGHAVHSDEPRRRSVLHGSGAEQPNSAARARHFVCDGYEMVSGPHRKELCDRDGCWSDQRGPGCLANEGRRQDLRVIRSLFRGATRGLSL